MLKHLVGPAVAKKMQGRGAVVVLKSKSIPTWALIAAPWTSQADVERIRAAVIALNNTDSGRKIFAPNRSGRLPADQARHLACHVGLVKI